MSIQYKWSSSEIIVHSAYFTNALSLLSTADLLASVTCSVLPDLEIPGTGTQDLRFDISPIWI